MNAKAQSQVQSSSTPSFTPAPVNLVQRKCACGGSAGLSGECGQCQKEKLVGENAPLVQPKLKIGQPNDKYEQEADRVADEVMRMPEPKVQRQVGVEEDEETIQTKPIASQITPLIQRQVGPEEEKQQQFLNPRFKGKVISNQKSDSKPKSNKEEAKDALKKTGEAFLKTEPGKEIVKKGKEIVSTLPGAVITGTAAVGAVSALIATNKKLPIQAPAIPLDGIHPGLSMKITVEGPLRSPTKAMISFSGKFGIGKRRERRKPDMTQAEKQREENNRKRREDFEFRESLKTSEEKARDNQRLLDTVTSRLPIPGLKSQEEVPAAEKEKKEETHVQRKKSNNSKDISSDTSMIGEATQSTGQPLDATIRNFMEQRFGHDFSQVKIHTDDKAIASARAVNARAFTLGQDVMFGSAQYSPKTRSGQQLLAHELTHVVQQDEQIKSKPPSKYLMPYSSNIGHKAVFQSKRATDSLSGLEGRSSEYQKANLVGDDPPQLQPKLKISQPNDKFEQESDRVADEVMRMHEPEKLADADFFELAADQGIQRKYPACAEEELQRQPIKEEEEEELQAKERSGEAPEVTSQTQSQIESFRTRGEPLSRVVRSYFESRFGVDFGAVRIHTEPLAAQAARDLRARAFTNGWNIAFANGEFAPDTLNGRKLLAHELTHTLQQNPSLDPLPEGSTLIRRNDTCPNNAVEPVDVPRACVQGSDSEGENEGEMGTNWDQRPHTFQIWPPPPVVPRKTQVRISPLYGTHTLQQGIGALVQRDPLKKDQPESMGVKTKVVGNAQINIHTDGKIVVWVPARKNREGKKSLSYRALAVYFALEVEKIKEVLEKVEKEPNIEFEGEVKKGFSQGIILEAPLRQKIETYLLEHEGLRRTDLDRENVVSPENSEVESLDGTGDGQDLLTLGNADTHKRIALAIKKLRGLPPEIKDFLFTEGAPKKIDYGVHNYRALLSIADLAQQLTAQERADYLARARGRVASDWTSFKAGLEKFVAEQERRGASLIGLIEAKKLLSTIPGNVWEAYKEYRFTKVKTTRAGDVIRIDVVTQWLNEQDPQLSMREFSQIVDQFFVSFQSETASVALTYLDRYQSSLLKERERYSSDDDVSGLKTIVDSPTVTAEYEEGIDASPSSNALVSNYETEEQRQEQEATAKTHFATARKNIGKEHPLIQDPDFDLAGVIDSDVLSIRSAIFGYIDQQIKHAESLRTVLQDPTEAQVVFAMDELMEISFSALGMPKSGIERRIILDYTASEATTKAIRQVVTALTEVVVGIIATIVGGPFGFAVAVASAGKSVYDLSTAIEEWRIEEDAYRVGLDSEAPSLVWVAVAAAGAAVDVAAAAKVFKVMKAFDTGQIDDLSKLTSKLKTIDELDQSKVEVLVDAARARKAAKSLLETRLTKLGLEPSDVDASFRKWLAGLSDEATVDALKGQDKLVRALTEMDPDIRRLLTKCSSDCLPEWLKAQGGAELVNRVQKLQDRAKDASKELRDLFHDMKSVDEAKKALKSLEEVEPEEVAALAKQLRKQVAVIKLPKRPPHAAKGQVKDFDEALLEKVMNTRSKLLQDAGEDSWFRNIAAAKVKKKDGTVEIWIEVNDRSGLHSEAKILNRMKKERVVGEQIYSERIPCKDYHCMPSSKTRFDKVYYGIDPATVQRFPSEDANNAEALKILWGVKP